VQICLEQAPDFLELRHKLFAAQDALTTEQVMDIASSGRTPEAALKACIASPETQAKLEQDILYAWLYAPQGTPLVVVNGRQAPPVAAFLYVLALAEGDLNAPAFGALPPAQAPTR
jgi:protein-disulfide isomerase